MNKLKFLIDLDSTCNAFLPYLISAIKSWGYGFDSARYFSVGTWDIEDFIIGTDDPSGALDCILKEPSFWKEIPVLPGAFQVLQNLHRFHNVTIVTAPWGTAPIMKDVKVSWVLDHFPFFKKSEIIFNNQKWLVPGDVIFDDKPETIEKCKADKITVVPDQPYNRKIVSDFRFKNWFQVPAIIEKIERKMNS